MAVRSPVLLVLGAALLTASLAGCSGITEASRPTINRYAAVNITARTSGPGQARGTATVIFFDALSVQAPSSVLQQTDECVFSAVDTLVTPTVGQNRAGSTIGFTAGSTSLQLAYSDTLRRYATPAGQPFTYSTGDQARVTIPGAADVFPAQSISIKLAEPLVPGPVAAPLSGQPYTVTWNGTNDPTAAIILSIKYANPATASYANEQIYCALRDDGSHTSPATGLTGFLGSPANRRSVTLTRWRTTEAQPDARTLLHVATSVDTTVVVP
ncbi:hypothetical protein [Gemmatimonas sp.]|uniref:hypothetical protein n=1 Tax=Gemmatimonas sp. TaxID=1962908 RepID=UPI00391F544E